MAPLLRRSLYLVGGALLMTALAVGSSFLSASTGSFGGRGGSLGAEIPASQPTQSIEGCDRDRTLIATVLDRAVRARVRPSTRGGVVASFGRINRQGARQVFDVLETVPGGDGQAWFRVLLPMRPNGTVGFVPARTLRLGETPYRIVVDRGRLTLTLWEDCRPVHRYPIGLGTDSTPTPSGRYYITSLLKPPTPNTAYGTYAYGLSAYSDVLVNWKQGGIIGLHGTNDPASVGRRVSHGCIRMLNRDIEALVKILPLGTP